jgi:hypothetical protein
MLIIRLVTIESAAGPAEPSPRSRTPAEPAMRQNNLIGAACTAMLTRRDWRHIGG